MSRVYFFHNWFFPSSGQLSFCLWILLLFFSRKLTLLMILSGFGSVSGSHSDFCSGLGFGFDCGFGSGSASGPASGSNSCYSIALALTFTLALPRFWLWLCPLPWLWLLLWPWLRLWVWLWLWHRLLIPGLALVLAQAQAQTQAVILYLVLSLTPVLTSFRTSSAYSVNNIHIEPRINNTSRFHGHHHVRKHVFNYSRITATSGTKTKRHQHRRRRKEETSTQWFRTAKNRDVSTGPLARPFARSLAPLTPSLVGQWFIRLLFCLWFFYIRP